MRREAGRIRERSAFSFWARHARNRILDRLCGTEEWLRGNSPVHIPSSLPQIISTLPSKAAAMLGEVVNSGFVNDPKRTLLADVLNPATHGDALVSFVRIGSTAVQGNNWAQYLARLMNERTQNFVALIKELVAVDLESIADTSNTREP